MQYADTSFHFPSHVSMARVLDVFGGREFLEEATADMSSSRRQRHPDVEPSSEAAPSMGIMLWSPVT